MLRIDELSGSASGGGASRLAAVLLLTGCSTVHRQPPGVAPTAATITQEHPGGDAGDPHEAALLRQLNERWGFQEDKDGQLRVPLVDWKNYERVRYWAIDHFVGFKYGSDYHVLNVVLIQDVPDGAPMDSKSCLQRAEKWGHPQLKSFEVKLGEHHFTKTEWRGGAPLLGAVPRHPPLFLPPPRLPPGGAPPPPAPPPCPAFRPPPPSSPPKKRPPKKPRP